MSIHLTYQSFRDTQLSRTPRLSGFVAVVCIHIAVVLILADKLAPRFSAPTSERLEISTIFEKPALPVHPVNKPEIEFAEPGVFPAPEIDIPPASKESLSSVEGKPYEISNGQKGDTPPQAYRISKPDYPASARRLGQEGTVILLLHLSEEGRVLEAEVEESSGFILLDDAAKFYAIKNWRFKPALDDGTPIQIRHRMGVVFALTDK